jgi:predicted ArsR family transcriptional regulator
MSEDMPRPKTVSDDELLSAIKQTTSPVASTSDVSEQLDINTDATRKRLRKLEERGEVDSMKVGARAAVWWCAN